MGDKLLDVKKLPDVPLKCTTDMPEYKMCTLNFGQENTDSQIEMLKNIAESHLPDIIFCQKNTVKAIVTADITNVYGCCYDAKRFGGAILVKKSKINRACLVEYDSDADKELEQDNELRGRLCTVLVDNMIAISWRGMTGENKETDLKKLLKYAFQLSKGYELPVIIGGDFNLPQDQTIQCIGQQILLPDGIGYLNNSIFALQKGKESKNHNYFVLLSAPSDTDGFARNSLDFQSPYTPDDISKAFFVSTVRKTSQKVNEYQTYIDYRKLALELIALQLNERQSKAEKVNETATFAQATSNCAIGQELPGDGARDNNSGLKSDGSGERREN